MRRVTYTHADPLLDWSDEFKHVDAEGNEFPVLVLWPEDWRRWLVMDCAWSNEGITYDFLYVAELVGGRAMLDGRELPIRVPSAWPMELV